MSKVALVFPYFRTKAPTEMLFPPLGAASLSSQLRSVGIQARIFDCTFMTFDRLQTDLDAYQPQIVGIYSMIGQSSNTFRIAEYVRNRFQESLLVAGGPMPTLYPGRFSEHFDVIFRGEVDLSFPRFCQDYFTRKITPGQLAEMSLADYDGLFVRGPDFQIDNPTVHYPEEVIRNFPIPDRSDFDHNAYQQVWQETNGSKTTSMITTLGCPFNCDFCSKPIFGDRFRRRDLDAVFEEIEQIRVLGYDSLWIADDTLTLNAKYLGAFCQRMEAEDMSWSCLSRVTGITRQVAQTMSGAGCRRVYLGLETANQVTLELMNKKATVKEGIEAVHQFRNAGIEVAAFFLVGYPGESIQSIEETFELALTLPLNYISFNVPYPLPGSNLFNRVQVLNGNRDWNVENEVTFLYESEFDQDWLKLRIDEAMQAFAEKAR